MTPIKLQHRPPAVKPVGGCDTLPTDSLADRVRLERGCYTVRVEREIFRLNLENLTS